MNEYSVKEKAFIPYTKGKYAEALPLLTELAAKGHVQALLAAAWINENGKAGSSNVELAQHFYQKAADSGSVDALHRLGRLLLNLKNPDAAKAAFERGANQGHLPCMCDLGLVLIEQAKDPTVAEEGMNWLKAAASDGHLFAQRKMLQIESSKKITLYESLKLKMKFLYLTLRYFREFRRDWNSDKVA